MSFAQIILADCSIVHCCSFIVTFFPFLPQNRRYSRHFERPERITKIQERFQEYNLLNRMECLKSRTATISELELMHKNSHIAKMKTVADKNEDLVKMGEEYTSIYLHESSFKCAALACGSTLQVVDAVLNNEYQSGVCIVRPPGHHASSDIPSGFCIFNNVAVAAQYAVQKHKKKRSVFKRILM